MRLPKLHFKGRFQVDENAARTAFRSLQQAQHEAMMKDDPELAALLPALDPAVADPDSDQYIAKARERIAPYLPAIQSELDEAVEITLIPQHVHKPWGDGYQDFIGEDALIRRTDSDAAPLLEKHHMAQPDDNFWQTVLETAQTLNR